jgi:hypothetical protein
MNVRFGPFAAADTKGGDLPFAAATMNFPNTLPADVLRSPFY